MLTNSKSISKKLFTITLGLILGVFFITLFFQLVFFEEFYLYKKKDYLLNQANEFRYMYSYQIHNNEVLSDALTNYEEKNSSRVAIIPLNRNDVVYVSNNQNSDNTFSTLTNFCAELLYNTKLHPLLLFLLIALAIQNKLVLFHLCHYKITMMHYLFLYHQYSQ